jgi:hypothetical protein
MPLKAMSSFQELSVSAGDVLALSFSQSDGLDHKTASVKIPKYAPAKLLGAQRNRSQSLVVPMKRGCRGVGLSRAATSAATREIVRRRRERVHATSIVSPAIQFGGPMLLPEGGLPVFLTADILVDASRELQSGAWLATIKCVLAWRAGHLETRELYEFVRSMGWQSPAMRAGIVRTQGPREQEFEVLSDEDFAGLMCP